MAKLSGKIAIVSDGNGTLGKIVVDRLLTDGVVVNITLFEKNGSSFYSSERKQQHPEIL